MSSFEDFKQIYDAPWVSGDGSTTRPPKFRSNPGRLRGGQSVDIYGFFAIVFNILKQEDPSIHFVPAYPDYIMKSRDYVPTKDEPTPSIPNTITFKVVRKTRGTIRGGKPHGSRTELKPMIREEAAAGDKTSVYTTKGQRFDCTVQLDCWSATRFEAELLGEYLEDIILKYTGLIMSLGIQQVIFQQRLEDAKLDSFRIPMVSIQYLVNVEKIWYLNTRRLEEIRATFKINETVKT